MRDVTECMNYAVPILFAFVLVGCGPWPNVPESGNGSSDEWPVLLPIESVIPVEPKSDEAAAQAVLLERAERLQNKANVLRRPVPDDDAMERLRQSLAS